MAFDKKKYDTEYNIAHVKNKRVPFNNTNPEDVKLLAWLEQQGNCTQYIKRLIRDDMNAKNANS